MFVEWPGGIQTLEPESLFKAQPRPHELCGPRKVSTFSGHWHGHLWDERMPLILQGGPAGRLTCTSHFTLLEPQFPSPKTSHLSLGSNEGSQGKSGQGGKGTTGGGGRIRSPSCLFIYCCLNRA